MNTISDLNWPKRVLPFFVYNELSLRIDVNKITFYIQRTRLSTYNRDPSKVRCISAFSLYVSYSLRIPIAICI